MEAWAVRPAAFLWQLGSPDMRQSPRRFLYLLPLLGLAFYLPTGCRQIKPDVTTTKSEQEQRKDVVQEDVDTLTDNHATELLRDGRRIFRYDTFGSEAFWGD